MCYSNKSKSFTNLLLSLLFLAGSVISIRCVPLPLTTIDRIGTNALGRGHNRAGSGCWPVIVQKRGDDGADDLLAYEILQRKTYHCKSFLRDKQ